MQKHSTYLYIIGILWLCNLALTAQQEKMILRDGNNSYHGGNPLEAANYYKKALQQKQDYYKANFNLGDALYKTAELVKSGKIPTPDKRMTTDSAANLIYNQAAQQFEVVAKSVSNADTIQKAWHNYGNAKLMQKNYEDAILGYKKALKLNPKDEDARYNLAYAQKQLAKQNQSNKNNNKNQKNNDNKKQHEKDKQDTDHKNEKDKQEAQQPKMSKEQAEQMLNALKNNEKKLQALRKKKGDPEQRTKVEKDW